MFHRVGSGRAAPKPLVAPLVDVLLPAPPAAKPEPVMLDLLPSTASRIGTHDDKGEPRQQHVTAWTNTSIFREPCTSRLYVAESGPEERAYLHAQADPEIIEIEDQPKGFGFVDPNGEERNYTPDFRFTVVGGDRVVIHGKYRQKVDTVSHADLVQFITDGMPDHYASRIDIVTEDTFADSEISDATLLISVRDDDWTDLHDAIARRARMLTGPVSIDALCEEFGNCQAFRAIARLIDDGILERVRDMPIDRRCVVRLREASN